MDVDRNSWTPPVVGDCVRSLRLDKWCYQGPERVVAEQPLAECFRGFSGLRLLINLPVTRLMKQGRPDMVMDYIIYVVVHHGTDFPFRPKVGCVVELLNSLFSHVLDFH